MDNAITRIVERRFPELAGAYHLPRFAVVVAIPDAPVTAQLCDDFRPHYAVDLQVLAPNGAPEADIPILPSVPLPVPGGGNEMGFFAFPEPGTTVVVSFAYGLPSKPFILQILPHNLSLPRLPAGDLLWQHSDPVKQRADAAGNWLRQTDGRIHDSSNEREIESLDNQERYQNSTLCIDDHASERVGGVKTLEAIGALKLLSAGSARLAAIDDIHQATGRDLNLVIGQKHNAVVGGDMSEQIRGMRQSVAAISQSLKAPKTWIGSEAVNTLQVLTDLINLVADMNAALASHVHAGPGVPPANSGDFSGFGATAIGLKAKQAAITL